MKWIRLLPFLGILAFYLFPLLIRDTGSAMLMLLVAMPAACFACSLVYGLLYRTLWLFPVLAAILFVPTIFLYYNSSAWVYAPIYGVVALIGAWIGRMISKKAG